MVWEKCYANFGSVTGLDTTEVQLKVAPNEKLVLKAIQVFTNGVSGTGVVAGQMKYGVSDRAIASSLGNTVGILFMAGLQHNTSDANTHVTGALSHTGVMVKTPYILLPSKIYIFTDTSSANIDFLVAEIIVWYERRPMRRDQKYRKYGISD